MEEIVRTEYRTKDGEVFDNRADAEKHEKEINNPSKDSDFATVATIERVPIFKKDIKDIFIKMSCHNCPFGPECKRICDLQREHSSTVFTLCDGIIGK